MAYFFSLPDLADFTLQHNTEFASNPMKNLLRSHAWTRTPVPAQDIDTPEGWPRLGELKVLYILAVGDPAHEGLCIEGCAEGAASACRAPNSTASSITATSVRWVDTSRSHLLSNMPTPKEHLFPLPPRLQARSRQLLPLHLFPLISRPLHR